MEDMDEPAGEDEDVLWDPDRDHERQRRQALEMTPAERLRAIDQFCREMTRMAMTARRVR